MSIKARLSLIIVLIGFILFLITGFMLWTQLQGSKQDQFSHAILEALKAGDGTDLYSARLKAELEDMFRSGVFEEESLDKTIMMVNRSVDKWVLSLQSLVNLNIGFKAGDIENIKNLRWIFAEIRDNIDSVKSSFEERQQDAAAARYVMNVKSQLDDFIVIQVPEALSSFKFMIGNAYYENFAQSSSLWKNALLILAMIALVILLVSYRLLWDVLKSISVLKNGAEVLGTGNLDHRIDLTSKDEMGQLASTFNTMTDNLKKTTISRDYVDNIIRSMIGSLIVTAPDGKIKTVNSETCKMLRYEEQELIGKSLDTIFAEGDHFLQSGFDEFFEKGEVSYIESRYLTKDKEELPVVFSGSIMRDVYGEMQGMIFVAADITAQKEAEERQAELLKELDNVNKELKDFAYIVSHDLKAPLRAIHSLATWISSDYADKLDEDGKEQLSLLRGRVVRMQGLIDGILHYSRVGRVKEKKTTLDLNTLVKEMIDFLSPPSHINISIENHLPQISSERVRVEQVFQNLIGNAIKYMDKEKGEIKVACQEENDFWRFSISDNGPGIDEKYFEKIFQIFQTLKPRDEVEGTGIGLAVVKKIVELNGGKIWVESEVGKGSRFLFTFAKSVCSIEKGQT